MWRTAARIAHGGKDRALPPFLGIESLRHIISIKNPWLRLLTTLARNLMAFQHLLVVHIYDIP